MKKQCYENQTRFKDLTKNYMYLTKGSTVHQASRKFKWSVLSRFYCFVNVNKMLTSQQFGLNLIVRARL